MEDASPEAAEGACQHAGDRDGAGEYQTLHKHRHTSWLIPAIPACASSDPCQPWSGSIPAIQRWLGARKGEQGGEAQPGGVPGDGHGACPSTQPVPPGAPQPLLVQPLPHSLEAGGVGWKMWFFQT